MSSEAAYFTNVVMHVDANRRAKPLYQTPSRALEQATDEELLAQVAQNSKAALGLLFRRHQRAVLNIAWLILRDYAEAEDLRQEVFISLSQKANLFDPAKGTASSWIIQIAYRRAIDRRRYLACREHYNALEFKEELVEEKQHRPSVDEITARALLNQIQGQLSAGQRQALDLYFFEGYSLREIAQKTDQSLGNTRNHFYRGLERLRSLVFSTNDARERKLVKSY
jgi:RNA polymerase sigma-70 factor (ECF subfamily)